MSIRGSVRRITFDEVNLKAVYKWKDPATGRQRQTTKLFFQTINPFNKNAGGQPKTREEILVELKAERDVWLASMAGGSPTPEGAHVLAPLESA